MDSSTLITAGGFGLVLLVVNVAVLTSIFFTQRKMNAINRWPQTMGTILMSTTQARRSSDGSGGYTHYPVVMYSYQVGGQGYQGSTIAPGPEVGGSGADKVVARYPSGTQVMVFYNPQNPSDAVLERKAPAQFWLWFILIIFDIGFCIFVPVIYFVF